MCALYERPNKVFHAQDGLLCDALCPVSLQDFPELPMYVLPRLREVAPEHYDVLRCMPVLDWRTWRDAGFGDFTYACQSASLGFRTVNGTDLFKDLL